MASLIQWLAFSGSRKADGTVNASGIVYVYQAGTSTAASIYSNAAASTTQSNPVTLDAAGKARVWVSGLVDVLVEDSAGASIGTVVGTANAVQGTEVQVTNAGWTGTNPTTGASAVSQPLSLDTMATAIKSSTGGPDAQYQATAAATAKSLRNALREREFSITDFGATTDTTVDNADFIEAAYVAAAAAATTGNAASKLIIPAGTYRIDTLVKFESANVIVEGEGPQSIIKNYNTSGTAIEIDLGSAITSGITLRDFNITHNSTSSATGILLTNGNRVKLERVTVTLHRTGINTSAVTRARLIDCEITATDGNSAGVGINLGPRSSARDCTAVAATGTGFTLSGAYAMADGCRVEAATATGFSFTGADTQAVRCFADACTTGFSVGAVARVSLTFNKVGTNTTDLSVNASATGLIEFANQFPTISDSAKTHHDWIKSRLPMWGASTTTSADAPASWTPDPSAGNMVQVFNSSSGAATTLTVGATSTTGLSSGGGELLFIQVMKPGANTLTVAWNAQYQAPDGTAMPANNMDSIGSANSQTTLFRWNGSAWRQVFLGAAAPV